jgi:hypothetical protein
MMEFNRALGHYTSVPNRSRNRTRDVQGNTREIVGYLTCVTAVWFSIDSAVVYSASVGGVPVLAPFEDGLAAAFDAGTACGCHGTDILGLSYVLPGRLWTGRDGVEHRGVMVTMTRSARVGRQF